MNDTESFTASRLAAKASLDDLRQTAEDLRNGRLKTVKPGLLGVILAEIARRVEAS